MKYLFYPIISLSLLVALCSCQEAKAPSKSITDHAAPTVPPAPKPVAQPTPPPPLDTNTTHHYPWLEGYTAEQMLLNRIAPPQGFQRRAQPSGSFAAWLRHLPLKAEGAPVYLHNGELKGRQDVHYAVLDIDTGRRDLQQCADAVMRLKAEYHYAKKDYEAIHFNYTSGDRVGFADWARGRKPRMQGNRVVFTSSGDVSDFSYLNFRKYLVQIFSYAGTASLSKELERVEPSALQIGDVFIKGGFPGHAVIVVDVAENAQGERAFLLAQSYMPAQEIHILRNPAHGPEDPWYNGSFGERLVTPEWDFTADQLKRFAN
ncbi:MAG: DUF4846 domain-containing protein [Bacteroidota bacterium]